MKDKKDVDKDGLPKIPPEDVENYIEYYEKLIRKKVNSNIGRVREQALRNIQKRHKDKMSQTRSKGLERRIEEIRAFYEGDIIKMDKAQKNCQESKKEVKWYEWDMVMVIPNPDYEGEEEFLDEEEEEGAEEAARIYKACFKKM